MRVAIVVTGGLHPSGREQVVPSWLSLFGRLSREHDIHAFAVRHLPAARTYQLNGITVHDLGRPSAPFGLGLWAQGRALSRAMADAGPFDLVHGFWADPAGILATRMARRFSIPSIVTCDSGEFVALDDIGYGSQRTSRGRERVREAVMNANRVHVCTTHMAEQVLKFGVTPIVILLGVEVPDEIPQRTDGPPWSLLQVGSLSRVKNQSVLIEALAIASGAIDVHLDLVGEDTLDGELQALAMCLGVIDRVTFHGFVPHDSLEAIRRRAHLYVQTSRHESAGVAVLEAAVDGLPVLGTRVGYLADWAAPGAARAIDDIAPESLAVEIMRILASRDLRSSIAHEAATFARRFDADATAVAFDRLYRAATPTAFQRIVASKKSTNRPKDLAALPERRVESAHPNGNDGRL